MVGPLKCDATVSANNHSCWTLDSPISSARTLEPMGLRSTRGSRGRGRSFGSCGCCGHRLSSRSDLAELDIGEDDGRIGVIRLYFNWVTLGASTRASHNTCVSDLGPWWVGTVEPEHAVLPIIPDTEDQCHPIL